MKTKSPLPSMCKPGASTVLCAPAALVTVCHVTSL